MEHKTSFHVLENSRIITVDNNTNLSIHLFFFLFNLVYSSFGPLSYENVVPSVPSASVATFKQSLKTFLFKLSYRL